MVLEGSHDQDDINLNGCNKLKKNSFNNMVFMEINVMFDNTSSQFNNTNSSSADRQKAPPTNLDTQILPKKLASYLTIQGRLKS